MQPFFELIPNKLHTLKFAFLKIFEIFCVMIKKFKVWKSDGSTEIVEAQSAEYKRKKNALTVVFINGKSRIKMEAVIVCEILESVISHAKSKPEENDDED